MIENIAGVDPELETPGFAQHDLLPQIRIEPPLLPAVTSGQSPPADSQPPPDERSGAPMNVVRVFEIISWFSLPTVMFGGFSLLRLLTSGRSLTPFQATCFRAGHAHAGVLLLMSLLYYQYLVQTTYSENSMVVLGARHVCRAHAARDSQ
jgi:hypothetical protein